MKLITRPQKENKWLLLDIWTWAKHSCHWLKHKTGSRPSRNRALMSPWKEGDALDDTERKISFWSSETVHWPLKLTVKPRENASRNIWPRRQRAFHSMTSHPGTHIDTASTAPLGPLEKGPCHPRVDCPWKVKPAIKLEQGNTKLPNFWLV